MLKVVQTAICTCALAVLIGCSGFDTNQVLMHPEQVKPSASFNVALVNIYTYLSMDSVIAADVKRDSLHLLVGLPESWSVESAFMVVADDMTTTQLLALQDNVLDQTMLAGLLLKYQSRVVTLPVDGALASQISGDSISAHDRASGDEIMVKSDAVNMWKGFSAPVNILLAAGSKPDTMIALDTILGVAAQGDTAMAELTANPLAPEMVGINMIPVIVFLTVKSGTVERDDTLYYFSKTGAMNPPASALGTALPDQESAAQLAALEAGSMTFVPIAVSNTAAVAGGRRIAPGATVSAASNRRQGTVSFDLGSLDPEQSLISIYSLRGALIASITPQAQMALWDGNDLHGHRLPAGAYVARIGRGAHSQSLRVQLIP